MLTGGFLFFKKVPFLFLENMDRPRTFSIQVSPSEPFSISYIHSIYKEPVVEEFQIHQGGMVLKGIRTKHPGVLEYYQFEDTKEFHPMDRRFGMLFFKIGMGEPQGMILRDREISFSKMGEKGDRIRLGLRYVSLGSYLFHRVVPQTFTQESH
jgi:hypothetical protein